MSIKIEFVPIDKEQPELPFTECFMEVVPFPGEDLVLTDHDTSEYGPQFEVRVVRRQFFAHQGRVRLFVRVLPPQGTP